MRILCVAPLLPVPVNSGSRIRVFRLLEELARTDEVDLVSIEPPGTSEPGLAPLRAFCRHVDLVQPVGQSKAGRWFGASSMALRGIPLAVRDVVTPDLQRLLRHVTAERDYDIIQIEESHSAPLLDAIAPGSRARTVLSLHNVAWLQARRIYQHEKSLRAKCRLLLTWLPMRFR